LLVVLPGALAVAGCAKVRGGIPREGASLVARMPVVQRSQTHGRGPERRSELAARGLSLLETGRPAAPVSTFEQLAGEPNGGQVDRGPCPAGMASIDDKFCIDRFESALLEVTPDGTELPFSSFDPIEGRSVRAVSEAGVVPRAYISGKEAAEACGRSGKRLCKKGEWRKACVGPDKKRFGYGDTLEPKRCNDHGRNPLAAVYGSAPPSTYGSWEKMNNPALNQVAGTVAKTGEHDGCTNGYGVYDMVGNVHEWIDDRAGTFLGGYYQDITINGDGCGYEADAHDFQYHDYSTGFRCCADPEL
jgi:hypothetical protein